MTEINASTGRRFSEREIDAGYGLIQSIEDRLYTLPGVRPGRPLYGSLATATIDAQEIIPTIREAFRTEQRITSLRFQIAGDTLKVLVNGHAFVLGAGAAPPPVHPTEVSYGISALDGSNRLLTADSPIEETANVFSLTFPATTPERRTWFFQMNTGRLARMIMNTVIGRTAITNYWRRIGRLWVYDGPLYPVDTYIEVEVQTV